MYCAKKKKLVISQAVCYNTDGGNAMQSEEAVFVNRLYDLAEQACKTGKYRFTGFLGLHEQNLLLKEQQNLNFAGLTLFGGCDDAERRMARFGCEELCGYEQPFPITLLRLTPRSQKYADALSHRDVLGALMGLGIERSCVGDIYIKDNIAFVFVVDQMADLVCRELSSAKHTTLDCERIEALPDGVGTALREEVFLVASERLDCIVAAVFNLSRDTAAELFRHEKVFVNGITLQGSRTAPEQAVISVRGFGRFRYGGVQSFSRKGKPRVTVWIYE